MAKKVVHSYLGKDEDEWYQERFSICLLKINNWTERK